MANSTYQKIFTALGLALSVVLVLGARPASAQSNCPNGLYNDLGTALAAAQSEADWQAAGLKNDMWAVIVDTHGVVCAVRSTTGSATGTQWLGSRVIAAQKANTANLFSLKKEAGGAVPGLALSTANLWAATQPGGSLFGLQFSNPVDTAVAYGSNDGTGTPGNDQRNVDATLYGKTRDPMVGWYIGGVNVFGGGLALYNSNGNLVGGLGLSGDTSCADHIKAWIVRDKLGLDYVPAGVSPTGDDNIIFDTTGSHANIESKSGFGHPKCGFGEENIAPKLPTDFPIGTNP